MVEERRRHPRLSGGDLIAEIRGARYPILDISFGGIKVEGRVAAAGALITVAILLADGSETAEVPARVERVVKDLTAVRFSTITEALTGLIVRGLR